jgi:FkbM family methyltransferase
MLISAEELRRRFGLRPRRILHVGAHAGEESQLYAQAGWGRLGVTWVEALPEKVRELSRILHSEGRTQDRVLPVLAWSENVECIEFYETTNGQSSSALRLLRHAHWYPEITVARSHSMPAYRLDSLIPADEVFDLVNLDVQGAELHVLRGLGHLLDGVQAVYSEVNVSELYEDCCQIEDLDGFLGERGFERVWIQILEQEWGDALWIRARPRRWWA